MTSFCVFYWRNYANGLTVRDWLIMRKFSIVWRYTRSCGHKSDKLHWWKCLFEWIYQRMDATVRRGLEQAEQNNLQFLCTMHLNIQQTFHWFERSVGRSNLGFVKTGFSRLDGALCCSSSAKLLLLEYGWRWAVSVALDVIIFYSRCCCNFYLYPHSINSNSNHIDGPSGFVSLLNGFAWIFNCTLELRVMHALWGFVAWWCIEVASYYCKVALNERIF